LIDRKRNGPVYRSGLERLCQALMGHEAPSLDEELMQRIRTRAGLLTHPAAVTSQFVSAVDALREAGAGLAALFGPEHGVRGDAPDGWPVNSAIDARTRLPVYSLYQGGAAASIAPAPEMFDGLGVLLVDLQDVGARFYTFASTVSHCMEAAGAAELPVVVLDRLNPIGRAIEGPLLRPEFASFVGLHGLPVRHGCTMGEMARLFHHAFGVGRRPFVVPFHLGQSDARPFTSEEWLRRWVPPSPNIPTPLTALVYPGTCLLEGTNLSEGRGTARPFEWLGAPWIDADALVDRLRSIELPGTAFRRISFVPTASKWAGQTCAGVHVHVTDVDRFRPVRAGVTVIAAVRSLWPEQFQWLGTGGRFGVDRLTGTDRVRLAIDREEDPEAIAASWRDDETAFHSARSAARLYP
jgi:uncharacterized protein YbbC (DUF1343 family)